MVTKQPINTYLYLIFDDEELVFIVVTYTTQTGVGIIVGLGVGVEVWERYGIRSKSDIYTIIYS